MRKLRCLLVSILLFTGEDLLAQLIEVSGKMPDPAGMPVLYATTRVKTAKRCPGASMPMAWVILQSSTYGDNVL